MTLGFPFGSPNATACSHNGLEFLALVFSDEHPDFQSLASGVAHMLVSCHRATSSFRFLPPCFVPYLPTRSGFPGAESWASGVVQSLASVARFVCNFRPVFSLTSFLPFRLRSSLISPAEPAADGVGHMSKGGEDEEASANVRSARLSRRKESRLNPVAHSL